MTDLSGPDLCYCLASRRGARHLARLYDRHLSTADINTSQFSILSQILPSGTITVAELAKAMVMERTTLVRALKPLQRKGWVIGQAPKQGRAVEMSLSAAGRRKVAEAAPMWQAAQEAFEAEFGREQASALRATLLEIGRDG